jgi:hypothetical protein
MTKCLSPYSTRLPPRSSCPPQDGSDYSSSSFSKQSVQTILPQFSNRSIDITPCLSQISLCFTPLHSIHSAVLGSREGKWLGGDRGVRVSAHSRYMDNRTPTFRSYRKVDFIDFSSKYLSNAFLYLFSNVPFSLQALWQARWYLFVFQLSRELKSLQKGPALLRSSR